MCGRASIRPLQSLRIGGRAIAACKCAVPNAPCKPATRQTQLCRLPAAGHALRPCCGRSQPNNTTATQNGRRNCGPAQERSLGRCSPAGWAARGQEAAGAHEPRILPPKRVLRHVPAGCHDLVLWSGAAERSAKRRWARRWGACYEERRCRLPGKCQRGVASSARPCSSGLRQQAGPSRMSCNMCGRSVAKGGSPAAHRPDSRLPTKLQLLALHGSARRPLPGPRPPLPLHPP